MKAKEASNFIPGLKLGELFYEEAIKPILQREFPGLIYAAALIGSGSEILGYDTEQSTDHDWGARMMLFLSEAGYAQFSQPIRDILDAKLPHTFRGYATHRVEMLTVRAFFTGYLGFDPTGENHVADWLTCSEQRLLTATAGQVYHDGSGELTRVRQKLVYYPQQVWLYLLAVQWRRISQEEAFVGRTGDVGNDLGSRIIAARLIRDLMKLCFLMEKQYAPYSKWFGTAFARLTSAEHLTPIFQAALSAETWRERESHLSRAYQIVAERHNMLGITQLLPTQVSNFHERPYQVIHADTFADAIRATITDPDIQRINAYIGGLDQFIDSTDVASNATFSRRLLALYN